jgi:hypothetical protein
MKSPRSTASTKTRRRKSRRAPANISTELEAEMDEKRKALGVSDELYADPRPHDGQMLVALGEDGIKTVDDFAGCAADDLVGWSERKNGETKRSKGSCPASKSIARRPTR